MRSSQSLGEKATARSSSGTPPHMYKCIKPRTGGCKTLLERRGPAQTWNQQSTLEHTKGSCTLFWLVKLHGLDFNKNHPWWIAQKANTWVACICFVAAGVSFYIWHAYNVLYTIHTIHMCGMYEVPFTLRKFLTKTIRRQDQQNKRTWQTMTKAPAGIQKHCKWHLKFGSQKQCGNDLSFIILCQDGPHDHLYMSKLCSFVDVAYLELCRCSLPWCIYIITAIPTFTIWPWNVGHKAA